MLHSYHIFQSKNESDVHFTAERPVKGVNYEEEGRPGCCYGFLWSVFVIDWSIIYYGVISCSVHVRFWRIVLRMVTLSAWWEINQMFQNCARLLSLLVVKPSSLLQYQALLLVATRWRKSTHFNSRARTHARTLVALIEQNQLVLKVNNHSYISFTYIQDYHLLNFIWLHYV